MGGTAPLNRMTEQGVRRRYQTWDIEESARLREMTLYGEMRLVIF